MVCFCCGKCSFMLVRDSKLGRSAAYESIDDEGWECRGEAAPRRNDIASRPALNVSYWLEREGGRKGEKREEERVGFLGLNRIEIMRSISFTAAMERGLHFGG